MVQTDCLINKKVICIGGPTASGKSKVAAIVANKLNLPVISADSMQIYKHFNIGTAKPDDSLLRLAKHYMIDVVEPETNYNAFMFAEDALKIISNNDGAVVAGGTGLYFESLIYGLDFRFSEKSSKLREQYKEYEKTHGREALHSLLKQKAPSVADSIHPNNVKAVIRALEIHDDGEKKKPQKRSERLKTNFFCLNMDRALLYERINKRVDIMIDNGLIEEVKALATRYDTNAQPFQAIGYKEVIEHINGKISYENMINAIKQNTRNYAKRQLTFFKRLNPIWLDAAKGTYSIVQEILEKLNS